MFYIAPSEAAARSADSGRETNHCPGAKGADVRVHSGQILDLTRKMPRPKSAAPAEPRAKGPLGVSENMAGPTRDSAANLRFTTKVSAQRRNLE